MVGRGNDDGVDVGALEKFAVVAVTSGARGAGGFSRAFQVAGGGEAALGVHVEDIADGVEAEAQVALAHELFIALVARFFLRIEPHALDPVGVGEAGAAHERLAFTAEADDSQPDRFTRFARLRPGRNGWSVGGDAKLVEDLLLLEIVPGFLTEETKGADLLIEKKMSKL